MVSREEKNRQETTTSCTAVTWRLAGSKPVPKPELLRSNPEPGKPLGWVSTMITRVRSRKEFAAIVAYVERNPVSAGFVGQPEDWVWSSAKSAGGKTASGKS
jgi:hypothetical protein